MEQSLRLSTVVLFRCRAKNALLHHSATLRHLPWETNLRNSLRARSQTAYANGIPSADSGSSGYDHRDQAESGTQGSKSVYCYRVKGRGWHDSVGRSVFRGHVLLFQTTSGVWCTFELTLVPDRGHRTPLFTVSSPQEPFSISRSPGTPRFMLGG
jgi:hypothetical protein